MDLDTKIDLIATDPYLGRSLNGMPLREDDYLLRLGADYSRYTQMRRDPHVRAMLNKRKQSILGRRMIVEAASQKLADRLGATTAQTILDKIKYERLCSSLLNSGQLIGFSVLKVDWVEKDGLILPEWQSVHQNRIGFVAPEPDKVIPIAGGGELDYEECAIVDGYELRLLTRQNPYTGERCPKSRFVVYTFDGDGSPWGLGLGYSIYPWWSVKREAMKSWLLQSDRVGSPPSLGTHPEDLDESNEKDEALLAKFDQFLASVSPSNWARLPETFKLILPEGISLNSDVHERLINLADGQISKAILGEVQWSDKTSGSYSANASQVEDRDANLTDADCANLDETLSGLWEQITKLNAPRSRPPIVRRETIADQRQDDAEQQKKDAIKVQADTDTVLIEKIGLTPTDKHVSDAYGDEWTRSVPGDKPSLNDAQLQSILKIVDAIASGNLTPDAGQKLIVLAAPIVPDSIAAKIVESGASANGSTAVDAPTDPGVAIDQVAGMFSEVTP